MAASIGHFLLAESNRDPEARVFRQELKARRRHADDRMLLAVEQDLFSDQSRVAAEPPLPEPIADQRHFISVRFIFFLRKNAPQFRLDAEQREEVGGYGLRLDLLRFAF